MVSNPADYTVSDLIQNRTLTTPASPIGFTISFDTNGGGANPGNVISTRPFSTWTITTNSIPESSIVGNVLNITENAMGDIEIRADW